MAIAWWVLTIYWVCYSRGQSLEDYCADDGAFACGDGTCLSPQSYCNGITECGATRADELYCGSAAANCPVSSRCKYSEDGPCYDDPPNRLYGCDDLVECPDASDELGCGYCNAHQFHCYRDGKCRHYTKFCDGVDDCGGQDEIFCDRFCVTEVLNLLPPERLTFTHSHLQFPNSTGFYKCSWLITSDVNSYIFMTVVHLRMPKYGKLRLSVGVGNDSTVAESVMLATSSSAKIPGFTYIGRNSTEAWVHIRSSRLITGSENADLLPSIELMFYQQEERLCPTGLISCPEDTMVTVCISQSAVCNGQFDCPDYWDEIQCSTSLEEKCGPQDIVLDSAENRSINLTFPRNSQGVTAADCLWWVTVPSRSRVEIIIHEFTSRDFTLQIGRANSNRSVDLSTSFLTVTADLFNTLSKHSPVAGEPIWVALDVTSSQPERGDSVHMTLTSVKEAVCGQEEFACYSSVCLPLSQRCDGIPQCPSLADERGCDGCKPGIFRCDGVRCLDEQLLCDGVAQCQDMMDEYLCGRCVDKPAIDLTDGTPHLISFSPADRPGDCLFLVTASEGHRVSIHLRNVPRLFPLFLPPPLDLIMGDGHDPSDQSTRLFLLPYDSLPLRYREVVTSLGPMMWIQHKFREDASRLSTFYSGPVALEMKQTNHSGCGDDEFKCGSGTCISQSSVCDNYVDCLDYSDEFGCGCAKDRYRCPSRPCLHPTRLCNKEFDCNYNSDEFVCGPCGRHAIELSHHNAGGPLSYNLTYPSYLPLLSYRSPADCLWLVKAAVPHHRVHVTINAFRVTPNSGTLSFGWSSTFSGNRKIGPTLRDGALGLVAVASRGRNMWLRFTLERLDNYSGISLHFQSKQTVICEDGQIMCGSLDLLCLSETASEYQRSFLCGVDPINPPEFFQCRRSNQSLSLHRVCDGAADCLHGEDEVDCDPCGPRIIELSRYSAGAPNSYNLTYPGYLPLARDRASPDCSWLVKAAAPDHRVHVTINAFRVTRDSATLQFGWGADARDVNTKIGPTLWEEGLGLVAVASRGKLMWLRFTLRRLDNYTGISLRIQSKQTVSCDDGQISCGSPDLLCVSETASEYQRSILCGLDICGERRIIVDEGFPYNLSSPNYPNNYPNDANCSWEVSASSELAAGFLVASILDFRTEPFLDKVTIGSPGLLQGGAGAVQSTGDAPLASNKISLSGRTLITTITSSDLPTMYFIFTSDQSVTQRGFQITIEAVQTLPTDGICFHRMDFSCENTTVCVAAKAVCNGMDECQHGSEELLCNSISCPEFFQCSRSRQCLPWDQVCDGQTDCLLRDDEINCDVLRCPAECQCNYIGSALYVRCRSGWSADTLENIAAITDVLELSGGNFTTLEPGQFKRFFKLQTLYLTNNAIEHLQPLSFQGLDNLLWLNVSHNNLAVLKKDSFKELVNLQGVVIQEVPLTQIEEAAFDGLKKLQTMVLIRGRYSRAEPIAIHQKALRDLVKLRTLYLDDHRLCCEFNKLKSFEPENCFTTELQSPLFNCGSLMQNTFLRVSMWILGLSALIGNFGVVAWRCRTSITEKLGRGTKYVSNFLILNLAVSDFLMGIYMVIIAAADVYFGSTYYTVASFWRNGAICKIAGVISVLSSEASLFFITLISVDRFLCIAFPFGQVRLVRKTARVAAVVIWVSALILSGLPTILVDSDSDVYGLSDVCIGLPLITKPASYELQEGEIGNPLGTQSFSLPVPRDQKPAWVYSIVLFLGVNLVCSLVIAVCYLIIFVKIRASEKHVKGSKISASRQEEMRFAIRMAVIVGTDFCCWMPVIIMGLLSQSGAVTIQPQIYAWTVVFILPINSSLNPYLYTVSYLISAHRSKSNSSSNEKALSPTQAKAKKHTETGDLSAHNPLLK